MDIGVRCINTPYLGSDIIVKVSDRWTAVLGV
jgi:hypothetical protein